MSKIETYRTAARAKLARGDRRGFLAMRRAECHVLLEQAKALPKSIRLQGPHMAIGSIHIVPTAPNAARANAIARICSRQRRLTVMGRRLEGAVVHVVDRCDGFYHLEARVAGFPAIDMSGKLASRSAAEQWCQRQGFRIANEVAA